MEKIYGIDPGYLADEDELLEKVNNFKEHELFSLISALHEVFFYMEHDGAPISEESMLGLRYLEQLTTKFGVKMEEPAPGKKSCRTPEFMKWCDFWHKHFDSLTDEEYNAYLEAKEAGEDVSQWLPKCRWDGSVEPTTEAPMQPKLEPKQ